MQTVLEVQYDRYSNRKKFITAAIAIAILLLLYLLFFSAADQAELEAENINIGTVKKGSLIQDIRAPGNLVPNQKQWISARANAKVEQRLLEPGAKVNKDSIILTLDSPELIRAFKQAKIELKVVLSQLHALSEQQRTAMREQQARVSILEIEKQQATQDRKAKQKLRDIKIIPDFQYNEAVLRQKRLTLELEIESFKLTQLPQLQTSLLKVEQAKLEQQQLQVTLFSEQVERLNVRAGMQGILQSISVEQGQQVSIGAELARVASQDNLKAQLRVQESQVKDIAIGQTVIIDTRRSKITGRISRIDPAVIAGTVTVDVKLPRTLPAEARPDLRVEGIVEIQRLDNILIVDKPANWKNSKNSYLYKFDGDALAIKTYVSFGISSVSSVQLLKGVKEGEKIILSDLSNYSQIDRIAIN
jgi:HlyD family secretion protein